jgi:hypothetical protein
LEFSTVHVVIVAKSRSTRKRRLPKQEGRQWRVKSMPASVISSSPARGPAPRPRTCAARNTRVMHIRFWCIHCQNKGMRFLPTPSSSYTSSRFDVRRSSRGPSITMGIYIKVSSRRPWYIYHCSIKQKVWER